MVNLGVDGKVLNRMDGRGLDRSGIGTVLMWPRNSIDVFQGPYCVPGTGLCGPWTVLMCPRDHGCDSGLYRCPRDD